MSADEILARCEALGWEVLIARHDSDDQSVRAWMRKGTQRMWGRPANTEAEARRLLAAKVEPWLPKVPA